MVGDDDFGTKVTTHGSSAIRDGLASNSGSFAFESILRNERQWEEPPGNPDSNRAPSGIAAVTGTPVFYVEITPVNAITFDSGASAIRSRTLQAVGND